MSDIDIARRLAILMRYRCTALHGLSVAYATQNSKRPKDRLPVPHNVRASMALRFVPYIGAVMAAAFPIVLAAAVGDGWTMTVWTVALFDEW